MLTAVSTFCEFSRFWKVRLKSAPPENAELNGRERLPLRCQRGLQAHPPEIGQQEHAYFLGKTILDQTKRQYYVRGVAKQKHFATPLE